MKLNSSRSWYLIRWMLSASLPERITKQPSSSPRKREQSCLILMNARSIMKLGQREAARAKVYRLSCSRVTVNLSSMGASMAAQHIVAVDWLRLRQQWDDEFFGLAQIPTPGSPANPRDEPIPSSLIRLGYVSLKFHAKGELITKH